MLRLDGMSPELWSTILLYGGVALMAVAAVLGIAVLILLHISKKRLTVRLEAEFGKNVAKKVRT